MGFPMSEELIEMEAFRVAKIIMREWEDSYSDSGAIWERSHDALVQAKKAHSPEILEKAYEIARQRWPHARN
jgi:hypothetical protein